MSVSGEIKREPDAPIFNLNAPPVEVFDEEKVHFSIYNEIKEENKTKQEEDWNLQMAWTAEWFIRCAWINKFLFINTLCQSTRGCTVLENVLKTIESIFSKDVLESLSYESTNFCYDKIPTDDNRTLEINELKVVMEDVFCWYSSLDSSNQIRVIVKLLRLGGGGLIYMVYKSTEKLYKVRQEIEDVSVLSSGVCKKGRESKLKIKEKSKSKVSVLPSDLKAFKSENNEPKSEFAQKKQQQLDRRNAEFLNYQELKGLIVYEDKKPKKEEPPETVDLLQILPIWLNRKILSYIDEKTLSGYKRVGKYWGKMIDESINEKSGRKAINAKINKIIGIKADKEEKKSEEKSEVDKIEFIMELGPNDLINKKTENEGTHIAISHSYEAIFSKRCVIKSLDSSFHPGRCGAVDTSTGMIACSTPSNLIHFYSARTGRRSNLLVFSLESAVSCIHLHENKSHIFIGCEDGSLMSKDIKTNKTISVYNGHSNAVLSIFTTPSSLLSASKDNTIKYFRLFSGLCLLCIDLSPYFNVSCLLLRNDDPSLAAIGTKEGFLVLADIEAKKFLCRVKLHTEIIKQITHDGDILITGSGSGKIRIWDMTKLEENYPFLQPYFNIDVGCSVVSLKVYKNQIFCGCENGTIKILSLTTGKIFKTLKISFETPITGVDVTEDKLFMKLIIWHEKGIEIRTFSLQKSSSKKISKEKDNQESKQKAPKETKKNKTSEMVLSGFGGNSPGLIEATRNAYKRTTFAGIKKPLNERCCTLSTLRTQQAKLSEPSSDVFTKLFHNSYSNVVLPSTDTNTE